LWLYLSLRKCDAGEREQGEKGFFLYGGVEKSLGYFLAIRLERGSANSRGYEEGQKQSIEIAKMLAGPPGGKGRESRPAHSPPALGLSPLYEPPLHGACLLRLWIPSQELPRLENR
jgi:hypothetical protein